ncbi:hypothetical protein ANANG_G00229430 [Anguilla anguilla]|uniref:Sesquipedalian n=1 Tax=Anguilla anguilla TaxID=7936 RepID=A0A9D3M5A8_ANGAN|nr:hypothetical protein ANANG_G00229430 [Anguilla anguilla]
MEGVLLKWTNYFSGWQPRYFVLKGLFLTYYLSKEDVGKAIEGSVKMVLCEIKVHPTDVRRFDLHYPGEQSVCLKVQSLGDRQRWLVALGSAKACLIDKRPEAEMELTQSDNDLRVKRSELQLCCHLLVEQVHALQGCVQPLENQAQSLLAVSSALRRTCSRFLGTPEECGNMCSCDTVPQPCALAPPVSHCAVGRPRQQLMFPLTFTARQTDGAVAERPVLLGFGAQSGQTVKRNIEQMATVHIQRRHIGCTGCIGHQGAPLTVSNNGVSDSRNDTYRRGGVFLEVTDRGFPPITARANLQGGGEGCGVHCRGHVE